MTSLCDSETWQPLSIHLGQLAGIIAGLGPHLISGIGFSFLPEKSMSGTTKGFGSVDIGFSCAGADGFAASLLAGVAADACGAASAESSMLLTWSITSAPPTGHDSPSIEPFSVAAFTRAAAKPGHPGKPQPPQFACGSMAAICPMRGSSSTANFLDITNSTNEAMAAVVPSVSIDDSIKLIMI